MLSSAIRGVIASALLVSVIMPTNLVQADAPEKIILQGFLRDAQGRPEQGGRDFRVKVVANGVERYVKDIPGVQLYRGVFTLAIDAQHAGGLSALLREQPDSQVVVEVDGSPLPGLGFGSSPFALYTTFAHAVTDADAVEGLAIAEMVTKTQLGSESQNAASIGWEDMVGVPADCATNSFFVGLGSGAASTGCVPAPTYDIKSVGGGVGLLGGGQSGSVRLEADFAALQNRINTDCGVGRPTGGVLVDGYGGCIDSGGVKSLSAQDGIYSALVDGGMQMEVNAESVQMAVSGGCLEGTGIAALGANGEVQCQNVQGEYASVIHVDAILGDPISSGQRLRQAVAAITASADRRALLLLGPGSFDIQNGELTLPAFVDLIGAGRSISVISGDGVIAESSVSPVLSLGTGSRVMRSFGVVGRSAAGISGDLNGEGTIIIDDVSVSAQVQDLGAGVSLNSGYVNISNVDIDVTNGEGMWLNVNSGFADNLKIKIGGGWSGLNLTGGKMDLRRVRIVGTTSDLRPDGVVVMGGAIRFEDVVIENVRDALNLRGLVNVNISGSRLHSAAGNAIVGEAGAGIITITDSSIVSSSSDPLAFALRVPVEELNILYSRIEGKIERTGGLYRILNSFVSRAGTSFDLGVVCGNCYNENFLILNSNCK